MPFSTTASDSRIDNDLPHPRGRVPFLGDILNINPIKPTQSCLKDARALGPIFERVVAGYPVVVVSGAALVAGVNDEDHWCKHLGVPLKIMRQVGRDGLITARNGEPNWAKAHNILAPAFTQQAMRSYHSTMTEVAGELLDYCDRRDGEWIDAADAANRFTLEVISRAGFDYTFESFGDDEHPAVAAMTRGISYVSRIANVPLFLQNTLFRQRARQYKNDIAFARKVVDDVVSTRRAAPENGERADMLGRMLTHADPDTGEYLDDLNIRNQILTFLIAGHETSAGVIAFVLHYLSARPDLADKARVEIDRQWPDRERPEMEFDSVAKLRYLRRAVDEALRLWPIAPAYFREARHDTTIGDGRYRFGKGDWVMVLTLAGHRDPDMWGPDADEFDPDRFLPDRLRELPPERVFKPFGVGPRACIGRQFAYHEILLGLAMILHTYNLEAKPGYKLEVQEQISLKPHGLRLKLHRR